MKKFGIVAAILAATLTLASCNDPNNPGPQPDEDCELERKKVSMIEPELGMIQQAGFTARSSGFRSSSRSTSRSWSSRSKSSTYRSKPSVKVPYTAPAGYRWVWDCD